MMILILICLGCLPSSPDLIQVVSAKEATLYQANFAPLPNGQVESKSEYSHFIVRDEDAKRTLYFVRDSGEIVLESSVDMRSPSQLIIPYSQVMMGTFVIQPEPKSALMVGVGGGAMIHYLQAYFPEIKMDAVDIDPEIISVAEKYFGIQNTSTLKLHAEDGFKFIAEGTHKYDVVYMDAFLKPSVETDPTGTHLRLKTLSFYEQLKKRLNPNAVVAFNINPHPKVQEDVQTIRDAFSQVWVVPVPNRGNTIVFASTQNETITPNDLSLTAKTLDSERPSSISYVGISQLFHGVE
jgi:spermidine synthase